MEHAGHDRLFIHLQVGQDDPHPQRMDDIGLSGLSHLVFVRLPPQAVGLLDHGNIGGGVIFAHPGDQGAVQFLRILIILRRLYSMAVY